MRRSVNTTVPTASDASGATISPRKGESVGPRFGNPPAPIITSPGIVNFVVVYRTGGDYDSAPYVEKIRGMVHRNMTIPHRVLILTDHEPTLGDHRYSWSVDMQGGGFKTNDLAIPLVNDWVGWWSLIEIFRIQGPVIFTGLDTAIVGELDSLGEHVLQMGEQNIGMIHAFSPLRQWASGIMCWNRSDLGFIYQKFNPEKHIPFYKMEQQYSSRMLQSAGIPITGVQDFYDGVVSYRHHCLRGLPDHAKFVLFHGLPRPHQVAGLDWMKRHWRSPDE